MSENSIILKKNILYSTTNYRGNIRYFPFENYDDITYYQIGKKIIELFEQFPENQYIINFHSIDTVDTGIYRNPLYDYLVEKSYSNFIISSGKFNFYIEEVDAVILDSPCTTLFEAMYWKKIIIAFIGKESIQINKNPEVFNELKKIISVAETKNDFFKKISDLLNQKEIINPIDYTSFLERFDRISSDKNYALQSVADILNII